MKTKKIKLSELTPDNLNANKGTPRALGMLERSLSMNGAGRSILVDKDGRIIAGNKTASAAGQIGLEDAIEVESNGERLIVVKRTDLSLDSPEGRALAIADNRIAEVGLEWDLEALEKIGEEIDLDEFWFKGEIEWPDMEPEFQPGFDADDVPDVEESTISRTGDLWLLGDHRVLCGDSTSEEDVARLMGGELAEMTYTDPPYGVKYTGGQLNETRRKGLKNDESPRIYREVIPVIAGVCDGPVYTWFAEMQPLELFEAVGRVGSLHALIIWHKTNATYGAISANYKKRHEPCLYWKPKGSNLRWCGPTTENTVWEMKRDGQNTLHPTQKPVALASRAISNHTAESVLDLFLGSGSTLIAAEQTGRKCFGMEIAPQYVDVIVRRWQEYTGKAAMLEDGPTFAEVEKERSSPDL